jgi:hypothetical protein
MSWDEAFASRCEEWSADMTADVPFFSDFAGEPFADDSPEYVFIVRR